MCPLVTGRSLVYVFAALTGLGGGDAVVLSAVRIFFAFSTLATWLVLVADPAFAERRVALVVGNAAYQHATRLQNPVNDAEDVTAKLQKLGFDVTLARDQSSDGFFDAVQVFANKLVGADIALFYYSGHGVQFDGANYLVPVDTRIEGQFSLKRKAVSAQDVVEQMERGAKVSLVFLDACRNNSLLRELEQSLPQQSRSAAANRGLARMESKGSNTLIVFATAPNDVASDGTGSRNSPFTAALLKHIDAPGVVVQEMLTDVSAEVERTTERRQRPEMLVKLTTKVRLAAAVAPTAPPPAPTLEPKSRPPAMPSKEQAARDAWAAVETTCERERLTLFLQRYGETYFGDLAQLRLKDMERGAMCVAALPQTEKVEPTPAPPQRKSVDPAVPDEAMVHLLQTELKRVGCLKGEADGKYGAASKTAVALFVRYSKSIGGVTDISAELLAAVTAAPIRVCPVICDDDERSDGQRCFPNNSSPAARPTLDSKQKSVTKQPAKVEPAPPEKPAPKAYQSASSRGGTCGNYAFNWASFTCTDASGRHCHVKSGALVCK